MKNLYLTLIVVMISSHAWAWGKRGHEITSAVAVGILAESGKASYLKAHEFDLGYYSNVPDLIWRNIGEVISKTEAPLHFLDWNKSFEKVFGTPLNLPLKFSDFKTQMGSNFDIQLGASPWRISELFVHCSALATNLTRDVQGPLLVCMGTMAHYIQDLGVPLHVTDNYDGQMTNQKGVHAYFETAMVEALNNKFELKEKVLKEALKKYSKLRTYNDDVNLLIRKFIGESNAKVNELLEIDKSLNRESVDLAKKKFKALVIDRLAMSAAHTAIIWEEILKPVKKWDDKKFYFFDGKPEYMQPKFLSESTQH
ncbi:MAG: hypothetical protein SGI74_02845 [Oligoflexia bacterium]|nr:hypothetical protein [Oligoflexia bacterium]